MKTRDKVLTRGIDMDMGSEATMGNGCAVVHCILQLLRRLMEEIKKAGTVLLQKVVIL